MDKIVTYHVEITGKNPEPYTLPAIEVLLLHFIKIMQKAYPKMNITVSKDKE
jgi:hypothetical protein